MNESLTPGQGMSALEKAKLIRQKAEEKPVEEESQR